MSSADKNRRGLFPGMTFEFEMPDAAAKEIGVGPYSTTSTEDQPYVAQTSDGTTVTTPEQTAAAATGGPASVIASFKFEGISAEEISISANQADMAEYVARMWLAMYTTVISKMPDGARLTNLKYLRDGRWTMKVVHDPAVSKRHDLAKTLFEHLSVAKLALPIGGVVVPAEGVIDVKVEVLQPSMMKAFDYGNDPVKINQFLQQSEGIQEKLNTILVLGQDINRLANEWEVVTNDLDRTARLVDRKVEPIGDPATVEKWVDDTQPWLSQQIADVFNQLGDCFPLKDAKSCVTQIQAVETNVLSEIKRLLETAVAKALKQPKKQTPAKPGLIPRCFKWLRDRLPYVIATAAVAVTAFAAWWWLGPSAGTSTVSGYVQSMICPVTKGMAYALSIVLSLLPFAVALYLKGDGPMRKAVDKITGLFGHSSPPVDKAEVSELQVQMWVEEHVNDHKWLDSVKNALGAHQNAASRLYGVISAAGAPIQALIIGKVFAALVTLLYYAAGIVCGKVDKLTASDYGTCPAQAAPPPAPSPVDPAAGAAAVPVGVNSPDVVAHNISKTAFDNIGGSGGAGVGRISLGVGEGITAVAESMTPDQNKLNATEPNVLWYGISSLATVAQTIAPSILLTLCTAATTAAQIR